MIWIIVTGTVCEMMCCSKYDVTSWFTDVALCPSTLIIQCACLKRCPWGFVAVYSWRTPAQPHSSEVTSTTALYRFTLRWSLGTCTDRVISQAHISKHNLSIAHTVLKGKSFWLTRHSHFYHSERSWLVDRNSAAEHLITDQKPGLFVEAING